MRSPTSYGKSVLSESLRVLLGRRNFARLGRFLWMQSRLDAGNDPRTNGEQLVQRAVASRTCATSECVVLDVGANVGEWSLSMLEQLRQHRGTLNGCSFHLFEPAPGAFQHLRSALSADDAGLRLELIQAAVAEAVGRRSLCVFGEKDGINTLVPMPSDKPSRSVDVDCTTVDAYCAGQQLEHVDLVKIDTEGNDHNVLVGARKMLDAGRIDYVQFEYNHRWVAFRKYLKDVFELVEPLGYSVGKITRSGVEPYARWHPELESFREGNYLLWRGELPKALPRIRWWFEGEA